MIAWGIPREYSDSNPCLHVPKLETNPDLIPKEGTPVKLIIEAVK